MSKKVYCYNQNCYYCYGDYCECPQLIIDCNGSCITDVYSKEEVLQRAGGGE